MPGVLLCCSTCQAHRGVTLAGILLCKLARQALKGAPWVGSYSVVHCVRSLMGQPVCCSAADAGMCGEREAMMLGPPPTHDSAVSPCFHGCLAFLHRHFPLQSCPSHLLDHLSAVNSSPCPEIAPQSLNSSLQLLRCLGYVWLQQGLSDSHSI